jgi:hypothetical protein
VLDALRQGEVMTTNAVARELNADSRVANIALEDLELLGVTASRRIGSARRSRRCSRNSGAAKPYPRPYPEPADTGRRL